MTQTTPRCTVDAMDHLVLTVADIARTVRFYTDGLGMRGERFEVADGTRRWALFFGNQKINLHESGKEFEPKADRPTPGSADLCFLSKVPIDRWLVHLKAQGIAVEDGPVRRSGATGPIISIYVRDPDRNLIEISVLEP
ncbi:MAG: VOC family protein [Pseudomonadota bacterium]